jgi:hypothetical protein
MAATTGPLSSPSGQHDHHGHHHRHHPHHSKAGFKLVDTVLKTSATERTATITNLPGECTLSDVRCFAIDAHGRHSSPSKSIEMVKTSKMAREEFILYELNEKKKLRDLEVDVILHDSHQIINRLVYIGLLELELKVSQSPSKMQLPLFFRWHTLG